MKALIIDIKKEYCILITPDGRFLKKDIPAGDYEIGDEIVIEEKCADAISAGKKLDFGIFVRIATGFAVVAVLTAGIYFSVKYVNTGSSLPVVAAAKAEQTENSDENMSMSKPQETFTASADSGETMQSGQNKSQELSEGSAAYKQESNKQEQLNPAQDSSDAIVMSESLPVLFEGVYSLDESADNLNLYIPVAFDSLDINYMIEKYPGEKSASQTSHGILHLLFKNEEKNTSYNGNISVTLMDEKNTVLDTMSFDFYNFIHGSARLEKIYFGSGYMTFALLITGEIK